MAVPRVGLRKVKRKNGYVYQIDYTIDGKRKRETVGTNKRQAELYQTKIQKDIMDGKLDIKKKEKISFEKLVAEYFQLHRNSLHLKTQAKYDGFVEDFKSFFSKYFKDAFEDISKIHTAYIVESQNHFSEKGARSGRFWSPSLCNSYKTFLAMLFKFAIKKDFISKNPATDVPKRRVDIDRDYQLYTEEQLKLIFNDLSQDWRDFFTFLLNTGLRLGECLNLTWDRVRLNDGVPKVLIASDDQWKAKTKDGRKVPLNESAKNILLLQKGKNECYVFTDKGKKIEKNRPLRELKKVLNTHGISGDVHQFRHTFASNFLVKNKGDNSLYDLAEILGHKDIKTTRIYAHLTETHLYEAVKRTENRISP